MAFTMLSMIVVHRTLENRSPVVGRAARSISFECVTWIKRTLKREGAFLTKTVVRLLRSDVLYMHIPRQDMSHLVDIFENSLNETTALKDP